MHDAGRSVKRKTEKRKKGRENYSMLKAASWYTAGNILVKGASFFVMPLFTRLMDTHEYGVYSVYASYLAIFEVVLLLGLSSTVNIAKYTDGIQFRRYIGTAASIPAVLGAASLLVLNICLSLAGSLLAMGRMLWNCMVITASAAAAAQVIGAELIIEGEYKKYMAYSVLATAGNIILSLLLCFTVYRSDDVYMARVLGNTISALASTAFIISVTKTSLKIQAEYVKPALLWGIPLLFHTLATVVLTQSDRIMIRYMDSYSAAGIYAIAAAFIMIPAVLETSLSQAWTPWFYERLNRKEYAAVRNLNDKLIVAFMFMTAEFMIVSPDIIYVFTDEKYWDSILSLLPLALSVFGEFLYSIPASVEYYYKKTTCLMTATMITVAANIILNFMLIQFTGYTGAAYATAASKMILFLIHCSFAFKADRNPVFHMKTAAGSMVFLVMLCMLLLKIYHLFFLRILCAAVTGSFGLVWLKRNWDDIKIIVRRDDD